MQRSDPFAKQCAVSGRPGATYTEHDGAAKLLVYCGLYEAVEWSSNLGLTGHRVYKFKLVRCQGQLHDVAAKPTFDCASVQGTATQV